MTREERKEKKRERDHARVLARQCRLADPAMTHRFCRTCQTTKPRDDFYPSCETRCRSCEQAKAAPRREQRIRYMAEWRRQNPTANRDWYVEHRSKRLADGADWRAHNPQQHRENYQRWAKANPDKVNALIAKRYARKRHATPPWADHRAIRAFYAEALRLTRDTGVRHEVDHIVPLQSQLVCGLHVAHNLQILTSIDNKKKRNHFTQLEEVQPR